MNRITSFIRSMLSSNKNVMILFAGTVISQLIPFALSPVLTRMFTPSDFGLFALYFSVTQVVSVFISARYEMAIILPKNHRDAMSIFILSCVICILISLLLFIPVLAFPDKISALFDNEFSTTWLYFIPVSVLVTGISQALINWFNRREDYKDISYSRIARSGFTGGTSILFSYLPFKSIGLIAADLIGQLVGLIYLAVKFFKIDGVLIKDVGKGSMMEQGKRYSQFPKYNVASGLFEKLAGHLPVFFLSSFFGSGITGYFSLSQRVISAPGSIIARSIGDVFRVEANAEYHTAGNAKSIFRKTFLKLVSISVVPFIILFFFAPSLFELVFGSEWLIAGEYAQWMMIMFFLQFVVSPLSNMFLVAERQKIDLYVQIVLVVAVAGTMVLGHKYSGDPKIVIGLFTAVYSCKYLFEFILSYRFSRGK